MEKAYFHYNGTMRKKTERIKEFLLDLFFPAFCVNCQKEGSYLCQDCLALTDILEKPQTSTENTENIYCAAPYKNFIVKKLIEQFENNCTKEIAKPLSSLILAHLASLKEPPSLKGELIPLRGKKKEIKKIGYDPATEIAKELLPFTSKGKNIYLVGVILNKEKLEKKAWELKQKGAENVSALIVAGE